MAVDCKPNVEGPRFIFSARPNEGSQTQLLRPRMLNDYIFPNVGLIMYGFFWLKFGLWLHSQGLDPDDQSELLLWTRYSDGTVDFHESILYSVLHERGDTNWRDRRKTVTFCMGL